MNTVRSKCTSLSLVIVLMALSFGSGGLITSAQAGDFDQTTARDQLLQWTMEDIARQRARMRQAEDEAAKAPPDLSALGDIVEPQPRVRPAPQRHSQELICTTVQLADDFSSTICD